MEQTVESRPTPEVELSSKFVTVTVIKGLGYLPSDWKGLGSILHFLISICVKWGAAKHRGSILASHRAAPVLNPSSAKIFLFTAKFVNSIEIKPI